MCVLQLKTAHIWDAFHCSMCFWSICEQFYQYMELKVRLNCWDVAHIQFRGWLILFYFFNILEGTVQHPVEPSHKLDKHQLNSWSTKTHDYISVNHYNILISHSSYFVTGLLPTQNSNSVVGSSSKGRYVLDLYTLHTILTVRVHLAILVFTKLSDLV